MGKESNGIVHPVEDGTTLQSEYYLDPDTGEWGHKQYAGIMDGRIGESGKVGVLDNAMMSTLTTGLNPLDDGISTFPHGCDPVRLTTSSSLLAGPAKVVGYYVQNGTITGSPTFRINDSLTSTTSNPMYGDVVVTYTGLPVMFDHPIRCYTGAYVTMSATISSGIIFFIDPTTA